MADGGWICLHRKLRNSAISRDLVAKAIWMDLLLEANWEDRQRINGEIVQRGEMFISLVKFAESIGATRGQLRRVLAQLENLGQIVTKTTSVGTHITICNYSTYNDRPDEANQRTTSEQPASNQRTTSEASETTLSNNLTSNKVTKQRAVFVKPTLDDVAAYVSEKSLAIDPQEFLDHYAANGWKVGRNSMKDWKATLRGWHKRRGQFTNDKAGFDRDAMKRRALQKVEDVDRANEQPRLDRSRQQLLGIVGP